MDKILHPVSGEKGYFFTELEKEVINVALEQCRATLNGNSPSSQSGELNG